MATVWSILQDAKERCEEKRDFLTVGALSLAIAEIERLSPDHIGVLCNTLTYLRENQDIGAAIEYLSRHLEEERKEVKSLRVEVAL